MKKVINIKDYLSLSKEEAFRITPEENVNESSLQKLVIDYQGMTFDELCKAVNATPIEEVYNEIFGKYK